jgi:hypothetical protein
MGDRRGAYRIVAEKHDDKTPLGRSRRRLQVILERIFKKWDGDCSGSG